MANAQPTVSGSHQLLYVDALRGLAVLGVLAFHVGQYGEGAKFFHPVLAAGVHSGARGVQLFFVMSAFTLFLSAQRRQAEPHATRNFFLRRLFRIVPMYWLALLCYGLWFAYTQPESISPAQIISNLLLVHGLHPDWINSAVPGGWSVGVEVLFYCLLPWLLARVHNLNQALRLVAVTWLLNVGLTLVLHQWPPVTNPWVLNSFLFFYLPAQLPVFGMGIALYYVVFPGCTMRPLDGKTLLALALVCFASLILGANSQQHFWFGAGFLLLALALSRFPSKWLVNAITVGLGKISYSLYLVHFAVLLGLERMGYATLLPSSRMRGAVADFALRFLFVLVVGGGLAAFFYRFVEQPFQRWGKRFIGWVS